MYQVLKSCLPEVSSTIRHLIPGSWFPSALNRVNKTKARVFCNLILEVTSHYFCHIVLFRSESLGPDHTQRGGLQKDINIQRQRSLRVILKTAYHCTTNSPQNACFLLKHRFLFFYFYVLFSP